jgi:anti-sigma B factor antagonist
MTKGNLVEMSILQLDFRELGEVTVVALQGSLDTNTADDLDSALAERLEAGQRNFVADLSELKYISSAGIGVLVGSLNDLQDEDGDLRIAMMPPEIAKVLEVLALLDFFECFPDQQSAIDSYT